MSVELGIVLFLCLAAEFTNGLTDAPNAIATVIATRVLSPGKAVLMAGVLNIVGVLVTGTAVAFTIGTGIVDPNIIDFTYSRCRAPYYHRMDNAGMVFWNSNSETHEMLAGLAGAGFATAGVSALLWSGWQKVLLGLGLSTVIGFALGYVVMLVIYWLFRRMGYASVRSVFGRLQILSAGFMAFSHGSNDGQKFMGCLRLH